MGALGRISGPLLKSNLIRDGVNLAFETDLLFLNVNNSRIGVNTATPTTTLDVNGTTKTTNLEVTNQLDIGAFTVTGNTISSTQPTINIVPSGGDPTIYQAKLQVDDIQITNNRISTEVTNSNLELRANGTGIVDIFSSTAITGDLAVSGNINAGGNVVIGGNITIGNNITDTITINAAIKSDLIPEISDTYDLGSPLYRWKRVYTANIFTDFLTVTQLNVGTLIFQNNTIESTTSNDIILDASGTGKIRLGNFSIFENIITNTVADSITQIVQTGTGYFKIQGTNGFVPPVGNDAQRPTAYMSASTVGFMRYNTNSKALEVWDGLDWQSPSGASGAVSENDANDIAAQTALMLG
jgi:hypothetical protein